MKVITTLLEAIAIQKESDFQDIFDDFKNEIAGTIPEKARSILKVVKREIEIHLYEEHKDYQKGIFEKSLRDEGIKLNAYFKTKYHNRDFTFIVRCEQIIEFCNDYFENKSSAVESILWKGDLKRFGAIFYTLMEQGYILSKTGKNGKVNYSAYAKLLISHFKFDQKTDYAYLARLVNGEDDKFESDFYHKIKVPNLNE